MYIDEMRPCVKTIGLRALDILNPKTQIIRFIDSGWVHLPDSAALNLPIFIVKVLIIIVSPLVFGLKGISLSSTFKNIFLINILDVQSGFCLNFMS